MTGEGEGKEGTACPQPHDFEKLCSPTNAASDWRGAGGVDYLAFETSIKPGIARYLAFADLSNIFFRGTQRLFSEKYLFGRRFEI